MKYIFNSLGSNYSASFVLHALLYYFFAPPKEMVMDELDRELRHRFPKFEQGPYYFYKGRDALEFILTAYGVAEDEPVLTQAFSCHALEAAIRRAGGIPQYVDLDTKRANPSVTTISAAYKKAPTARILIIQHTLGVPAAIEKIREWCTANDILLVEDLAQAVGGTDSSGALLGSTADAVLFSFGRDKVVDAVTGGACMLRRKPLGFKNENYRTLTTHRFKRDQLYPLLTYCIRYLYPIFLGRVLLYLARLFKIIQSPIKPRFDYITALPTAVAALAVRQLSGLESQLEHRRSIAQLYYSKLADLCPVEWGVLERGSNLRFPILVKHPDTLLKYLASQHIYIQDRWYRAAVDSGSLQYFSKYKAGSCPVAESFAVEIVNLPTHPAITLTQATYIAEKIQWYLEKKE